VKAQAAERENWNGDHFRTEKVRMLQEDLQNTLRQIDELKARDGELETKLLMEGDGKRDTMPATQGFTKCVVVGATLLHNVWTEHADMMVECIPGLNPKSYTL